MDFVVRLLRLEATRSKRHAPEMQVAGESKPVTRREAWSPIRSIRIPRAQSRLREDYRACNEYDEGDYTDDGDGIGAPFAGRRISSKRREHAEQDGQERDGKANHHDG